MSNERFSVGSYESSRGPGREALLSELEACLSPDVFSELLEEIKNQPNKPNNNHDPICVLYPDGSLEVR
jgi:hypothetical protein